MEQLSKIISQVESASNMMDVNLIISQATKYFFIKYSVEVEVFDRSKTDQQGWTNRVLEMFHSDISLAKNEILKRAPERLRSTIMYKKHLSN